MVRDGLCTEGEVSGTYEVGDGTCIVHSADIEYMVMWWFGQYDRNSIQ